MATPIVRQIKKQIDKDRNIIIDSPPGIGCPVIASVAGIDAGLIITEPTVSGIHDLERALQLLKHFNIRPFVCVNMHDINKDNTEKIMNFCAYTHI